MKWSRDDYYKSLEYVMGVLWDSYESSIRYQDSVEAAIARGDAVAKIGKDGYLTIVWRKK